jgi:hypothetical protein
MGKVTIATPSGYVFGNSPGMPRVCLVGRSHKCNFQLPAKQVSRRHLLLRVDDGGNLFVRDLGSRNGTFVNEDPLPMFIQNKTEEGMPPAGTPIANERLLLVNADRLNILAGTASAPQIVFDPCGEPNAEYGQGYLLKVIRPQT